SIYRLLGFVCTERPAVGLQLQAAKHSPHVRQKRAGLQSIHRNNWIEGDLHAYYCLVAGGSPHGRSAAHAVWGVLRQRRKQKFLLKRGLVHSTSPFFFCATAKGTVRAHARMQTGPAHAKLAARTRRHVNRRRSTP